MNALNAKKRILTFSALAVALALVATLLRTLCLFFFYDKIGYYQRAAALPVVSNIFYCASVVFFVIAARFLVKPEGDIAPPRKPAKLAALLPIAAMLVYLISISSTVFGGDATWYELLLLVFGIVSAVFFGSVAFCTQPSSLAALSGVGCIIWLALATMRSYFDFFVPMNSPDKLFFQLGAVGATLIVFSELRAMYRMSQPRAYFFGFFTGILAISVASVSDLIANAADIFASYTLLYEDIVMLSILVYAVVRLFSGVCAKSEE